MTEKRRLFIDGAWKDGSTAVADAVINPATEDPVALVAHADPIDVEAAILAAERSFATWKATTRKQRAAVLSAAARRVAQTIDEAAAALTREQGKTLTESRAEYVRVVETLTWHASAVLDDDHARQVIDPATRVIEEPIGVVGAFTPWNYPAVIAARKLGAALAAGCTVVLKGSEEAPSAAVSIVSALEHAGMPAGVVNLVFGDPPAISSAILDSPHVRAFSFTGSTLVGKDLAARAARTLKRCVLELGGHSPVLVFADADLSTAMRAIAAYKFECAGQSCNAPSRVYIQNGLYEAFTERFVSIARELRVGDGADPATQMGPMANARRLAALTRLTDDALSRGAALKCGGDRIHRKGYFWPPTVLADVPDTALLMSEEPFGPVLSISAFSELEDGISRANANPFGLASYVFTESPATAERAARALQAGSIGINSLQGVPPHVGIAGIKDSGYGYEGGRLGIEAFLNLKVVRTRS